MTFPGEVEFRWYSMIGHVGRIAIPTFDQFVGLAGLVGTLGFGVLSIILWFKTYKPKIVSWSFGSESIVINDSGGELQISFENVFLKKIVFSRIAIWSSGKAPISGVDIAKTDPVGFRYKGGGRFLSRRITSESSPALAPSIKDKAEGEFLFLFEWLPPGQGFIVELVHTEEFEEPPEFFGTLIGIDRVLQKRLFEPTPQGLTRRRIIVGAIQAAFWYGLLIITLYSATIWGVQPSQHFFLYGFATLLALAVVIAGLFVITKGDQEIPQSLLTSLADTAIAKGRFFSD